MDMSSHRRITAFHVGIVACIKFPLRPEGRRATIPGAKNPQEINAGFFHVLNADWAVKGGTFAGLNKGGPDFGTDFGIVRWF
jgi:hypothetical protein